MKKICITLFMMAALTISLSTYAQDNNKAGEAPKTKTEQVGEKSGKACCTEKKDKACCANKDKTSCEKKSNACCAGKDKSAKTAAGSTATTETKSCGKKVD